MDNNLVKGKILLIDADVKKSNDRTWSFWSVDEPEFACAKKNQWTQLGFASDEFIRYDEIEPYTYYTIHGIDFYNEVFAKMGRDNRIDFIQENILEISDNGKDVDVFTNNNRYKATKVIDSVSRPEIATSDSIIIFQTFLGWTVKSTPDSFNPEKPILMDFRVLQLGEVSFIYLLPYSKDKALIEFTQFAHSPNFDHDVYRMQVRNYIEKYLDLEFYTIEEEETGVIPMTNYTFDKRPSDNVFRVGTAGGDTKPATGYTFTNVQRHVSKIIMEITGVKASKSDKTRFKLYDNLLLEIINEKPHLVKLIMSDLFKHQPMARILKFLDEDTNLFEDALIFCMLPWSPFIKALIKSRINVTDL